MDEAGENALAGRPHGIFSGWPCVALDGRILAASLAHLNGHRFRGDLKRSLE